MTDVQTHQPEKITATERRELRSLVRKSFEVLKKEAAERHSTLKSDVNQRVRERYAQLDTDKADFEAQIAAITANTVAGIKNLMAHHQINNNDGRWDESRYSREVSITITRPTFIVEKKDQFSRYLHEQIDAEYLRVKTSFDKQELELLRELAIDAITSVNGIAFIERIPTVDQLLPRDKLAEIEAAYVPKITTRSDDHDEL